MKYFKYIFYFGCVFILLYFETSSISEESEMTLSQVWKLPLFVFFTCYVLFIRSYRASPTFVKFRFMQAVEQLFNVGSVTGAIGMNLMQLSKVAMMPLIYCFLLRKNYSASSLNKFILTLSQYFILSCIPFLTGLMQSTVEGMEYGDFEGFTGVFGAQHAAASVLSISICVIVFNLRKNKNNPLTIIYNLLLCGVALYALYLTLARTGWVMCLLGLLIIYMPTKIRVSQVILLAAFAVATMYTYNALYEKSDLFRSKIDDTDVDTGQEYAKGSGRLVFSAVSLELWESGNATEKTFGVGLNTVMENMYTRISMRIFSHNGYVDALVANGVVGLALMILFIIFMLINILRNRHSEYFRLGLIIVIQYASFQATQGGGLFEIDLFMAIILLMTATGKHTQSLARLKEKHVLYENSAHQ